MFVFQTLFHMVWNRAQHCPSLTNNRQFDASTIKNRHEVNKNGNKFPRVGAQNMPSGGECN